MMNRVHVDLLLDSSKDESKEYGLSEDESHGMLEELCKWPVNDEEGILRKFSLKFILAFMNSRLNLRKKVVIKLTL